jgi:pimeloyl-ACP methyl ester carboxylesterase
MDLADSTETRAQLQKTEDFRRVRFDLKHGRMAGIAFGDPTRAPDILFLHATGFNARTYRTLLQPLGARFHVVAVDMRGHGLTTLPARRFGYDSWRTHRNDILALLEGHFAQPVTLAGHSMGAVVALMAAGKRPDLVCGLALLEPVILSASGYFLMDLPGGPLAGRLTMSISRAAARRRAIYESREQAAATLAKRGIFRHFPPEVLADYVADGFIDDRAGRVRLACAPNYEAATFAAQRNDPWRALKRAPEPIVLIRAEHGSTISADAAQKFAARRPDARVASVEGAGHMLPIERPDRARAAIETAALMASPTRQFRDLI